MRIRNTSFGARFFGIAAAVEEKFPRENFLVNGEMRDEILVYESILSKFWAKMASKCRENRFGF